MPEIFLYLLTGVIAGLSAGLLGIGGGLIIVPVLFFFFTSQNPGFEHAMHMALATSLATIIFTSISSAYAHHKKNAVLWSIVFKLAPGLCVGAWLGGLYASQLPNEILKPAFGVFEIAVAIHLYTNKLPQRIAALSSKMLIPGGFVIGTVSAIIGIGGGTLTVPFLLWNNIRIKQAVATAAACGFPIAVVGASAYIYSGWSADNLLSPSVGYVHLFAFSLIIFTSVLCAPVGAIIAHKISENVLKKCFAVVILLIGIKMILT